MSFPVFFDTCALYGEVYCDLFLTLAEERLFTPYWSSGVLDELQRVVKDTKPYVNIDKRIDAMREFFPDSTITGYEGLIEDMTCDEGDRHVLAAAHLSPAHTLVTFNIKDFPKSSLIPLNMSVKHPDEFLLDILDIDKKRVDRACAYRLTQYKNKPHTAAEYEDFLKEDTPQFAAAIRPLIEVLQ